MSNSKANIPRGRVQYLALLLQLLWTDSLSQAAAKIPSFQLKGFTQVLAGLLRLMLDLESNSGFNVCGVQGREHVVGLLQSKILKACYF